MLYDEEPREHFSFLLDILMPVTGFTAACLGFTVANTSRDFLYAFCISCAATLILLVHNRVAAYRYFKPIREAHRYRTLLLKRNRDRNVRVYDTAFKEPPFQLAIASRDEFIAYRTRIYKGSKAQLPGSSAVFTRGAKQLYVDPSSQSWWLAPAYKRQHSEAKASRRLKDEEFDREMEWLENAIGENRQKQEEHVCKVLPFKRKNAG